MANFNFQFDKPDRKYTAGDVVRCKITVNVFSKFKARSFTARCLGEAHTEWTESRQETDRDGKSHTVYDTYDATEEYFRQYRYLFGNANASNETEVTKGLHTYDVTFTLPRTLPSSIDASYGYVRYSIKAKYDISWGFDNHSTSIFYVTSRMDLNDFPHLLEPVKKVREKTLGCCCYASDPMHLIINLPKEGYVPGEKIPITIQINNHSNSRIEGVRVKLKEKVTFITRSPRTSTRSSTKTFKEHYFSTPVARHQNKLFETEFYLNPNYNFKLFNGCGIITAEYYLNAEAGTSGCNSNPKQTTRITIGTIPFNVLQSRNVNPVFNPTASEDAPVVVEQPLPSYQEAAKPPSPLPGMSGGIGWNVGESAPLESVENKKIDDNLPPPSFDESQKLKKAIEAGEGEAPSAPVEHNPTAPSL